MVNVTFPLGAQEALVATETTQVPFQASIIIPAYNEEEALPHVLKAVFEIVDQSYDVIVVDDGSSDHTALVALTFPCRVISHKANRGKGAAMQTGIQHAYGDKVVFIDGDATYPVAVIPQVVRDLDRFDLVRCVRSNGRDNIPFINRLGNEFFDRLIKSLHQVEGSDLLSGLYGLRRRRLLDMRLESTGFDIETEIMVKARARGLISHYIPIQYHERIGQKKLLPVRDGLKILGRVMSLAFIFNPFATYILPGLLLWVIAVSALVLLGRGPLITPYVGLSTHTLIVSAMSFLAGFQLVVFGCVVNLYAVETGLGKPSRMLGLLAAKTPRLGSMMLGVGLVLVGISWSVAHISTWLTSGMGAFQQTETLVIALALVVWGIQLLSTTLFLSLFARSQKYGPAN